MAKKNLKGLFHEQATNGCLRGETARRLSQDGGRRFAPRVVPNGKAYKRKPKHGSREALAYYA